MDRRLLITGGLASIVSGCASVKSPGGFILEELARLLTPSSTEDIEDVLRQAHAEIHRLQDAILWDYDIVTTFDISAGDNPSLTTAYITLLHNLHADLGEIYRPLREPTNVIYIMNDLISPHTGNPIAGSASDIGTVKLDIMNYDLALLAHELAHVKEKKLDWHFHDAWAQLVPAVPEWDEEWERPRLGFLEPYAATLNGEAPAPCRDMRDTHYPAAAYHQDVATWVEHIYKPGFGNIPKALWGRTTRQKLKLLRDNKFISDKQYSVAKGKLGIR